MSNTRFDLCNLGKRLPVTGLLTAVAFATVGMVAQAALPFKHGNLVVYRVGATGAGSALAATGTQVVLDEYDTVTANQATPITSVLMPTAQNLGATPPVHMLTANGTSGAEGLMTRSVNKQYLVLTGYDAALAAATNSTAATATARVIGLVDVDGNIDTSTAMNDTNSFSTQNIRSATTVNGTDLWAAGSGTGVLYVAKGGSTPTIVSAASTNNREMGIFNGQLYCSSASGSFKQPFTVGTGLPTTSGQSLTLLPGMAAASSPYGYAFVAVQDSAVIDTCYVANATTIQKYSLVAGTWTANGSVTVSGASPTAVGIVASLNNKAVSLYYTCTITGGSNLQKIVDDVTTFNHTITAQTPVVLATASANNAFRGVAFTPEVAGYTVVDLVTFSANPGFKTGVNLTWETRTEENNVGFNVWRCDTRTGTYAKINKTLIAAKGDQFHGAAYGYVDTTAVAGNTYFYKIENMEAKGTSVFYSEIPGKAAGRISAPVKPGSVRNTLPTRTVLQ